MLSECFPFSTFAGPEQSHLKDAVVKKVKSSQTKNSVFVIIYKHSSVTADQQSLGGPGRPAQSQYRLPRVTTLHCGKFGGLRWP